ncbi:MAG: MBL fold metallo-hydrolase [Aestuariibacter sp.]
MTKYTNQQNNHITEPAVVMLKMQHRNMRNYNYLVVDPETRQAVIVDPAWEPEKVEQALDETSANLVGVLLTHSHHDHINLAKSVSEQYRVPIWMSRQEIEYSNFQAPALEAIDETPIFFGDSVVMPILTPGHTPGCTCYQVGSNLFTGDVLFAEGCGICPDEAAAHDMFHSLNMLKRRIAPDTRIYPGHSYGKLPGQKFVNLLTENIYLQFPDKTSFAAFRLRKSQNRASMFRFK